MEGLPETARCCSDRVFYNILLTFLGLGGAPETARCCSDHVFYNILLTFPGLGGAPRDRSMLLRLCILQYIINFPGSFEGEHQFHLYFEGEHQFHCVTHTISNKCTAFLRNISFLRAIGCFWLIYDMVSLKKKEVSLNDSRPPDWEFSFTWFY